jgi:hypothetical protein
MTNAYHVYLLRLWHASLEDSQTGARKGFADPTSLCAFLEEQTTTG